MTIDPPGCRDDFADDFADAICYCVKCVFCVPCAAPASSGSRQRRGLRTTESRVRWWETLVYEHISWHRALSSPPLHLFPLVLSIENSSNAIFAASLGLPATLAHPVRGLSYAVEQTGFTLVNESKDPFFQWTLHKKPAAEMRASLKPFYVYDETLEDVPDDQVVSNPELTNFNLAMAGGGKALAMAVLYDYPWGDLMGQTVVDVGAGVGMLPSCSGALHWNT